MKILRESGRENCLAAAIKTHSSLAGEIPVFAGMAKHTRGQFEANNRK
jgi:hypothetical protein